MKFLGVLRHWRLPVIVSLVLSGMVVTSRPALAQAQYIGDIGAAQTKTSGTSLAITTTQAVAAGDDIIIGYATDPNQSLSFTVTDSASNTYAQAALATNTGNGRVYIFAAYNVNALPSGSSITINGGVAVPAKAAVVSVFRGLANSNALDQALGNPQAAMDPGTTPTVGPTGTTTQANELVIGVIGTNGPVEDAAGTWGNSFVNGPRVGTTGGTAEDNWTVSLSYRIVSSTGQYTAQKSGVTSRRWASTIATFKTADALSPSAYNIVLGRPTNNSITVNAILDMAGQVAFEYGTAPGSYTGQTGVLTAAAGEPVEVAIGGLAANTKYYYRILYRATGGDPWLPGEEHSFRTQRAAGESFTFTVISDSHLGDTFNGNNPARYEQTTLNVAQDAPDFHLDIGDTFIMNSPTNQSQANDVYLAQRAYFGNFSDSAPVFLAMGNHENEEGWNFDDTPFSKALASIIARKKYFVNPVPDGFYTGNDDTLAAIGGDQFREDYYSWQWGDALFVVLDPFQYTMIKPYTEDPFNENETQIGDQWDWTLGLEQFQWFKQTLEASDAPYKFVFAHHMVGGVPNLSVGGAGPGYVRRGAEAASYFEWGGQNGNGTPGFAAERSVAQWGSNPIHQLMVANNVSAFFHGHDHQFVHEVRDGIVYQEVPSSAMGSGDYGFDLYDNSPYVVSGGNLPNAGHLRVAVTPENATVEYVRSVISGDTGATNRQVSHTYAIEPLAAGPAISLQDVPLASFASVPGTPSAAKSYRVSGSNLTGNITINAPTDFQISLSSASGYGASLTLTQVGGTVAETTIYVRFNRATAGTSSGNITHSSSGATTRTVAVSGTAAAPTPVAFNIILGRPTDDSVTANIIPDQNVELYIESGNAPGAYTRQTSPVVATANVPVEIVVDALPANAETFYRIRYRQSGVTAWSADSEHSFDTQKAPGSTFTFTLISDSHLGQYGGQTADEQSLYGVTLGNIDSEHPDFHIDLGDTFAMDPSPLGTGMTVAEADAAYRVQRPPMGIIGGSVPIFLAIGNHENEEGWNFDDTFTAPDQSLAVVGLQARKKYFPNPIPDGFYTGNTDPLPTAIGGDSNREDYYAWEWGDALFVVLDPYHYSMTWPNDDGAAYGGEGQDGEASGDRWDWTLGIQQYLWLKNVLETSDAPYKFVMSHHVTGGATPYGRGGAEAAPYFEWGGKNWDGSWGWDANRPASAGWTVPIHQLMVNNGVDVYFHGHDHIYAYEDDEEVLDGIVYLEVPKPDDAGYTWEPYGYGYTENLYDDGLKIENSGHIRVTVSPAEATFQYVRSYLPGDGTNGVVAHSFTIPGGAATTHELSIEVEPVGGGTTTPAVGEHTYADGAVVAVTATPGAGYVFSSWSGACSGSGACSVTMDGEKSVTANFTAVGSGATSKAVPSNTAPNIGTQIDVEISINVSGVPDPNDALGSFTASLEWNPNVLQYVSYSGPPAGFAGLVNPANAGTGHIAFNGANPLGATGNVVVYHFTFNVVGAGSSVLNLEYTAMAAAETFANLLPLLTVTDGHVDVPATLTLTYAAGPNGSLTGQASQTVNYGASGTAVTAVPNTGYHFVDWSDGSSANPRTDSNVTANLSVTANFAANTFTLNYTAGANGTLSGNTSQTVNYGASGTAVTAVPNTGYHFVNWSDGNTNATRTETNVTANLSVTANFAANTFTLTYAAGPNGSLTGQASQTVNYGASGTAVTAVPNTGYHFVNWSDGNTNATRTETNVTANLSVTANFAANTFTLTYAAGPNGSLTGQASQTVNYGASGTAVTAVPNTGYHFVNWSDGNTNATRTDTNVTVNLSVTANFAANTLTLTYAAGPNGTLAGNTSQTVNYGASGTAVTAVPNTGYHFVDWSDGSTANPRTETNVTANINVTANFTQIMHDLTLAVYPSAAGTTSPAVGVSTHAHGAVVDVTATPATGYMFSSWSGDCSGTGACQVTMDAARSVTAYFSPVVSDYVVSVANADLKLVQNDFDFDLNVDVDASEVSEGIHSLEFDVPVPGCLALVPGDSTQVGLDGLTFSVAQVGSGVDKRVKVVLAATDSAPPLTPIGAGVVKLRIVADSTSSACIVGNQLYTFAPAVVSCAHAETPPVGPWVMHEVTCPSSSGIYEVDYNEVPSAPVAVPLSVNENAAYSGDASSTDPDGDPVDFVMCANGDVNYHADTALFTITPAGALSSPGPFNFETKATYHVCVLARDDRGGSKSALQTISVVDVEENRAPSITGLSPLAADENVPYVGTIATFDPDSGDSIADYRLSNACGGSNNNDLFAVDAGNKVVPATGTSFDYEQLPAPTLTVCLEVEDQGGLTGHASFSITISNVEDVAWGDCNISGAVNATDLTSTVLEIWDDAEVADWLDAAFDSFRGSPEGCNSNHLLGSVVVNAADIACTVNLIFGQVCTSAAGASMQPAFLTLPAEPAADGSVTVSLDAQGHKAAAVSFTLKLDPSVTYEDVSFDVPDSLLRMAVYDPEQHAVKVVVAGVSMPLPALDGAIVTVSLKGAGSVQLEDVSAGNTDGMDLPVTVKIGDSMQFFRTYLPTVNN